MKSWGEGEGEAARPRCAAAAAALAGDSGRWPYGSGGSSVSAGAAPPSRGVVPGVALPKPLSVSWTGGDCPSRPGDARLFGLPAPPSLRGWRGLPSGDEAAAL